MKKYEELLEETIEWFRRKGRYYRRRGWDLDFLSMYIRGVTLDLGSGIAATTRRLLEKKIIERLVLVDLACESLEDIPDNHLITRICGDMLDEYIVENYFDTVLMIASLHNIPGRANRLRALRIAYKVLRPGGHLIVFVWSMMQLYFIPRILLNTVKRMIGLTESISDIVIIDKYGRRYYHLYRLGELIREVVETGFIIVDKGVFYPRRSVFKPLKNYYIVGLKNTSLA